MSVEVKLIGTRGKDFPKIMIATNKENKSTVVAFQSHGVGTVLYSDYPVFSIFSREKWDMSIFVDYPGEIVMKNS